MFRCIPIIVGGAFLVGCSTTQEAPPTPKEETKIERVSRSLAVTDIEASRGGAAIRQPGYRHVLMPMGDERLELNKARLSAGDLDITPEALLDSAIASADLLSDSSSWSGSAADSEPLDSSELSGSSGSTIRDETSEEDESAELTGFSHYELSRWERFCSGGTGMDEPDWRFVTDNGGASNVPSVLSGQCSPPNYSYSEYITAWVEFCEGSPSVSHRDIVANSVRPQSKVNPCQALNQQ